MPYGGGSKAAREVFLHISFYPTYQTAAPKTAPFVPEKIKGGSVFEVGTKVGTIGEEKTLKPCGFKVFYGKLHPFRSTDLKSLEISRVFAFLQVKAA